MWLASLEHEEENFGENSKTHRLERTIPIGLFSRKFFVSLADSGIGEKCLESLTDQYCRRRKRSSAPTQGMNSRNGELVSVRV